MLTTLLTQHKYIQLKRITVCVECAFLFESREIRSANTCAAFFSGMRSKEVIEVYFFVFRAATACVSRWARMRSFDIQRREGEDFVHELSEHEAL